MKRILRYGLILSGSVFLFSCGGSDDSVVSLYLTDKPANQVEKLEMTINKIQFLNTGNEKNCVLFSYDSTTGEENPLQNIDLLQLQNSYLFVKETKCDKEDYNRLRIDFNKTITVVDENGTRQCEVKEFNSGSDNQPNKPHCEDDSCFVEINGEVNIASDKQNVAIDFDLQQSEVNITGNTCKVKFKISPLHINKKIINDRPVILKGKIEKIDADTFSFSLLHGKDKIAVDYSNVTQEGINEVLNLALQHSLSVKVKCSTFNSENLECSAEEIFSILDNVTIVNLDETNKLFDINLNSTFISIDYSEAEIEGTIAEYAKAEIKVNGYSETDERYLAKKIEIKD